MKNLIIILIVIFSFGNDKIYICDDNSGWAPYAYLNKNHKATGFSIALLNEIFKRINMNYKLDMIPWKRCTYLVNNFNKTHKYEMFLDGSYSKDRVKKYYQSLPIYYTHQALFYSDKKFTKKQILNIVKTDVNSLKMCDVNGYQTNHYKINLGYTRKIDKSAQSTLAVLKKISKGRCDAIVCSQEPIYGGEIVGQFKIPAHIKSGKLDEYKPIAFYIWIAKTSPRGAKLIKKINQAIINIQKDGTYDKLYKKYVLDKIK